MCLFKTLSIRIDHHDERLLRFCGYVPEFVPASWRDIGSAESGPKLDGWPAHTVWRKDAHYIVIADGIAVEEGYDPTDEMLGLDGAK